MVTVLGSGPSYHQKRLYILSLKRIKCLFSPHFNAFNRQKPRFMECWIMDISKLQKNKSLLSVLNEGLKRCRLCKIYQSVQIK